MKKLDVYQRPLARGKEIWCDGVKIGEVVDEYRGEAEIHWYHSRAEQRFDTQTLAVKDLGKAVFGEEEFEVSPDRDKI